MSMKKAMRVALAVGLVLAAIPGGVRAFNPQVAPPARFGMVGLARTQMAVLNAVRITPVPDDGRSPCRLVLSFVDGQGRPFHDAAGREVSKRVELRDELADFVILRAADVLTAGQLRIPIRAVVVPVPDDGTPVPEDGSPVPEDGVRSDCRELVATLEIVGPLGATQLLYTPVPDDGQPVPDDGVA
jgi:hypothetical protein